MEELFTGARHSGSAGSHWLDRWEDHGNPIRLKRRSGHMCPGGLFSFPGLPVGERLMGMVCVSVPMYTLCMVVKEAFGGGDILLLSIMGFYLGWRALLPGVFLGFLLGGLEAVWLLASGRAKPGEGGPYGLWPGPVPGTWDQPVLWREDLFLVCGAFWLSMRRETYIMEGIERKKEWRSGELADFFSADGGDDRIGDPVMQGSGDPWGLYGQQKIPENI